MIGFLADENLNRNIVSGLLLRNPKIDIVRAQDAGLTGVSDEALLEWAAVHRRILLTHDIRTMTRSAYQKLETGQAVTGVVLIRDRLHVLQVIEDLLLIAECSLESEWHGTVEYLPL